MNVNVWRVCKVLSTYGSFAKPLINYIVRADIPKAWKSYFLATEYVWSKKFNDALKELRNGLKACTKKDATVYYLLKARELSVLRRLKDRRWISMCADICSSLRKEMHKIPPRIRPIVLSNILHFSAFIGGKDLVKGLRIWGENHKEEPSSYVFILLGKARRNVKEGNISEAISLFKKAFNVFINIPHPTGIVGTLNDMAWYLKSIHPKIAKRLAEKALFFASFYKEEMDEIIHVFDTLFEVEKTVSIPVETSWVLLKSWQDLSDEQKKDYRNLLEEIKMCKINHFENIYAVDDHIRNFIKANIDEIHSISRKTLRKIANGEVQYIKSITLQRIVKDLKITPPLTQEETLKAGILEKYNKAQTVLKECTPFEKLKHFISMYTSHNFGRLKVRDTLEETIEGLTESKILNIDRMLMIINMITPHPYIAGRKAAVEKAFKRMGKKLEGFARRYVKLKREDRSLCGRFLRNYGRYEGINFGVRFKGPETVEHFARKYRLNLSISFTAYWYEKDGRTRRKLGRILEFMVES
ncbi:MAG: hypothetical protein J7L52_07500 [Thermotogae bacterium]|nr:hypothetical protein [Thermotogota bacterium]